MSIDDDTRAWGPWSVWETEILLGGYLPLFAAASKRSDHRTFIDCFAGVSRNVERDTGREIKSSPRQALEAQPPFTHLLGFELPDNAARLQADLEAEFPGRAIKIVSGDANAKMDDGLRWWFDQRVGLRGPYLGAALAYLDPNSMELAWTTVETLARFGRTPPAPNAWVRQRPIELLILFPTGPLKRTLPQARKAEAAQSARAKVDRLFGDSSWRPIYDDQRAGVIGGEDSWSHYVNLYRYRLLQLGYSHTAAIEVRNTRRVVLYHMVFATGNQAGKQIMGSVMSKAREVLPRLLDDERRRRRSSSDGEPLFAAEDWETELAAAVDDPTRYARLLTEDPQPYAPGAAPIQEQLELDW